MHLFLRNFIVFFLSLGIYISYAQDTQVPITVKGKIIDEITNESLPFAVVEVVGTEDVTETDSLGNYTLSTKAQPPFVVKVSYAGYSPKLVDVYEEGEEFDIYMRLENGLSTVVITAAGIETSKKSINYTVTEIKGKELLQSKETNLTTALSGKVAGVQVGNSGGSPGGSSTVRIRGNNSVLGNNSPLFIVDGVPIDNTTSDLLANVTNSASLATPSNRAIDLNSDDIESVNVLKGPAAAALYGLRAANGAIVINTKKGNLTGKAFEVALSTSWQVDEKNRRLQPRQNKYSNGINGKYLTPGTTGSDESWGALIDTLVYQPGSSSPYYKGGVIVGRSATPNGQPVETFNNEENFFVKGLTQNYHVSVKGQLDKATYYASAGSLYQTGIVPTTDFYRKTFRFNGTYDVSKRLRLATGIGYTNSGANNRSLNGGYGTNAIRALVNSNMVFDVTNGYDRPWEHVDAYQLPATATSPWGASRAYAAGNGWNSPYWSVKRNPQKDDVNRYLGYFQAEYDILKWLKATYRYGLDSYRDIRNSGFANGSNGVGKGIVNVINIFKKDLNSDLIISANRALSKTIDLNVNAGHNYYSTYRYQTTTRGDNLIVPDVYNLANASAISSIDVTQHKKLVALFGSASVSYKKWIYLNGTLTNQWTSTLPKGKNSLLFGSAGTSFIFTEAFKIKNRTLSLGKIRATYAQVGNDTDPYQLETYYNNIALTNNSLQSILQTPFNGQAGLTAGNNVFSLSNVVGNQNLKPERIRSFEFGAELGFFKNRVNLDVAYYDNLSSNQIIPVSLPYSTGYRAAILNSGEISNKGIELALDLTPVKHKDFSWNATLVYAKNVSKVKSLAPGLSSLSVGGAVFADSRAYVGQPYGVLVATDYKRNSEGKIIINDAPTLPNGNPNPNYGYPIVNPTPSLVGDPNPAFNASLRNTFKYKFVTLSFLLDTRYGFDIVNSPRLQMVFNGVDESTENRGQLTVFEGVKNSNGAPNDIQAVASQDWYRSTFSVPGYYVEKDLYWLKLKDISLSFDLPQSWLKSVRVSQASLSFSARNIILSTNYSGSDPDLSSANGLNNGLGSDFWTTPNTRSYGTSLNLIF